MPLELAELAAGLPFAASFAMAGGISVLREGRRRSALNEAMHELRRPLQAIALAPPVAAERAVAFESSLRLAVAAVDRLDREINGRPVQQSVDLVPCRRLVESAVERGRVRASREGRALSLRWEAGDAHLAGDAEELAQILDNLISNGLDHGSGEVAVTVRQIGPDLRFVVLNRKRLRPEGARSSGEGEGARISGRRRHGHGLRIVRRAATRNGGSFRLRRRGESCEAVLDLPLAGGDR
ncbi:MAG TPA: ATP-binding protein [Solirubrobacterales bacterium]|nr:ATP-binding protein [Solirubrobacterales bacterium]